MKRAVLALVLVGCAEVAGIDDIAYGTAETVPEATLPAPVPTTAPTATTTATTTATATPPSPPVEVVDAGVDAGEDAAADAGPIVVDPPLVPIDPGGCTDQDFAANDRRGGNAARLVAFPTNDVQYAPHCMMIAVTQSVTFQGDFAAYPLAPGAGVGPLNPITATSAGNTATFQFVIPGKYKYTSTTSPTSMHGVIQVKGP